MLRDREVQTQAAEVHVRDICATVPPARPRGTIVRRETVYADGPEVRLPMPVIAEEPGAEHVPGVLPLASVTLHPVQPRVIIVRETIVLPDGPEAVLAAHQAVLLDQAATHIRYATPELLMVHAVIHAVRALRPAVLILHIQEAEPAHKLPALT